MRWVLFSLPAILFAQLQNEDFATVSQLQARGLTNAQAKERMLHDTKVWVTANSINKLLSQAIADGDIGNTFTSPLTTKGDIFVYSNADDRQPVGANGTALFADSSTTTGLKWEDPNLLARSIKGNLLSCPSFEGCTETNVSITVGSGSSTSQGISRSSEAGIYNDKSFRISSSAATSTLDYIVTKSIDFEGQQMIAYCEIKTGRSDVTFRTRANGADDSTLDVIGDNKWRYYEIPFVGGNTSQGLRIVGNQNIAGSIEIDNCFVGKANPEVRKKVGFKKTLTPQTDNIFSAKISTTGVVSDENHDFINGNCTITNTSTYTCNFVSGLFSSPPNCAINTGRPFGDLENVFTYIRAATSTSSFSFRAVRAQDAVAFTTTAEVVCTRSGDYIKEPIEESTIVTQSSELTKKTANEFIAVVESNGTISSSNFSGWISCGAGSPFNCTFESGLFSVAPICQATNSPATAVDRIVSLVNTTATGVTVRTVTTSETNSASRFTISCTRSTDYNKSATIVGKFENINSSDLVQVEASGNSGQAITTGVTNIPWANETIDNYNAWSGTTFVAPKKSLYLVSGTAAFTTAATRSIDYYVNGNGIAPCGDLSHSGAGFSNFSCLVFLNKDDSLTLRLGNTGGTLTNVVYHRLVITELPDTESIIKNLSTQKTKCQTKILPADVTTTGNVTSLQFNNLSVGKMYQLSGQCFLLHGSSTSTDRVKLQFENNSNVVSACWLLKNTDSHWVRSTFSIYSIFKAQASTLLANAQATVHEGIGGNGTRAQTFVQLCELPDTYVETTEFN